MDSTYLQSKAIQILARSLPRRSVYWVSDHIADLYYARDTCSRPAIKSNLRRILAFKGEHPRGAALEHLARRVFRGYVRNLFDFFHFRRFTPEIINRFFTIEGREHIERALSVGKGVIAISAHFGCIAVGAAVSVALGYPVHVVAAPYEDPSTWSLFTHQTARWGIKVIPLGRAARDSLDVLRNREILGLLCDFDYSSRDDRICFLGAPARMTFGPARIAAKLGVPILPTFVTRQRDERYLVRYLEPIIPEKGTSVETIQKRIVRVLEIMVLEHPHFWFIFSDFWDSEWSREIARQGLTDNLAAAKARADRRRELSRSSVFPVQ